MKLGVSITPSFKVLLDLLLFSLILTATAQPSHADYLELCSKSVVLLYNAKESHSTNTSPSIYIESGTGFLVAATKYHGYLVTAAHVSKILTPDSWVVIGPERDSPDRLKLKTFLSPTRLSSRILKPTSPLPLLERVKTKAYNMK